MNNDMLLPEIIKTVYFREEHIFMSGNRKVGPEEKFRTVLRQLHKIISLTLKIWRNSYNRCLVQKNLIIYPGCVAEKNRLY